LIEPERYVWKPGETPIFTKLLLEYNMGYKQNLRLWHKWDHLMYLKYASSGVCHCGADMENHPIWDNHSPVEMMYF